MKPEEIGRWIFATAKHLKVFVQSAQTAYLYAISSSARDGELLLRLRSQGTVGIQKLRALALDVGIPHQELTNTLERLESTNLIHINSRVNTSEIIEIHETILTENEVYRAIAKLFEKANPNESERTMLPLIDLLSKLPLTEDDAISRLCQNGYNEEDIRKALELQEAYGLLRKQPVSDFGITLIYNEYLWGRKIEKIGSILAKLQKRERDGLIALIEEVQASQGQSIDNLISAPKQIVALAAKTGILDTTTIITAKNDQKTFVFSPHFYGYKTGSQTEMIIDPADQVRLFLASIAYGVHHSIDFRLQAPLAFVRKLLREGEAGNATPILRDYILLEKQGIVAVKQLSQGRGTFTLQKRDIVEKALDVMESGSLMDVKEGINSDRFLVTQQNYQSPEHNRLIGDFGKQAGDTKQFDQDLLAAVREAAQRGTW
ncbi:MAG: hypothetical protein EI684_12345 [Candidatus Viridilinea halotolerans]|uniref:Uncharacterized protein n=1 Tax=Candidatus Viridilinea halotolerans TaxID=2491704 RepID=A0A426TYG7_9CHLR|nr:MAG: hypothetical protein EI684_12345 [Candidatus Viridilinea halotolerans]